MFGGPLLLRFFETLVGNLDQLMLKFYVQKVLKYD